MRNYFRKKADLKPYRPHSANLLPTGVHTYRFGGHAGNRIYPALRYGHPNDAPIAVRRSTTNLAYDHNDFWDHTTPFDNLHLSYYLQKFSSAGSLTIRGTKNTNGFTADYARFWKALEPFERNQPVDIVLLTGLDIALAATSLSTTTDHRSEVDLRRLRHGSTGNRVKALQTALGFAEATGMFGPNTTMKLVEAQQAAGIDDDGIFSPAIDMKLGFGVFQNSPP